MNTAKRQAALPPAPLRGGVGGGVLAPELSFTLLYSCHPMLNRRFCNSSRSIPRPRPLPLKGRGGSTACLFADFTAKIILLLQFRIVPRPGTFLARLLIRMGSPLVMMGSPNVRMGSFHVRMGSSLLPLRVTMRQIRKYAPYSRLNRKRFRTPHTSYTCLGVRSVRSAGSSFVSLLYIRARIKPYFGSVAKPC